MKVMDLHCDTISRIRELRAQGETCELRENRLHLDLKRMREGGYSMQTFALFTDADKEDNELYASMDLLDIFREEMKKNADWISQVITYADLEKNEQEGRLSALLSVEDGGVESFGMLFFAEINSLDPELHHEIQEIWRTRTLPDNWTYPEIQPVLIAEAKRRGLI